MIADIFRYEILPYVTINTFKILLLINREINYYCLNGVTSFIIKYNNKINIIKSIKYHVDYNETSKLSNELNNNIYKLNVICCFPTTKLKKFINLRELSLEGNHRVINCKSNDLSKIYVLKFINCISKFTKEQYQNMINLREIHFENISYLKTNLYKHSGVKKLVFKQYNDLIYNIIDIYPNVEEFWFISKYYDNYMKKIKMEKIKRITFDNYYESIDQIIKFYPNLNNLTINIKNSCDNLDYIIRDIRHYNDLISFSIKLNYCNNNICKFEKGDFIFGEYAKKEMKKIIFKGCNITTNKFMKEDINNIDIVYSYVYNNIEYFDKKI